ncbi:MAG: hypothetical protein QM775_31035 [Pirellulales bacterium]
MPPVSIPDTPSQSHARAIMGKDFLGLQEVHAGFGITYTAEQRWQLTTIPFTEATLRERKNTHVLVAGAPLSVNEIRKLAADYFDNSSWYNQEPFANHRKASVRWHLLRKEPVPDSCNRTYDDQVSLLQNEEVPYACEVSYMVILYWLIHRWRLLPNVYVRCRDEDSDSDHVDVGHFCSDGFIVGNYWNDRCNSCIGLASSVLLPNS